MKKSEYEYIKNDIEESIKSLKDELNNLKNRYINENRVFDDNEKVVIITKEHPYWRLSDMDGKEPTGINKEKRRYAFVVGYRVNYQNEVEPILKKCKKDGTISKIDDYFNSRIESFSRIKENV